jgi:hypothetical protein
MNDPTEPIRRLQQAQINAQMADREKLEQSHGQVWDTQQLRDEFEVEGFFAPYVIVRQKSTGVRGSLQFQHSPRFYFSWSPDNR